MKSLNLMRRLSLCLTIVILFSLFSACSGSQAPSSDNTSTAASQDTVSGTTEDSDADDNSPITFDVFINHTWYWTDKFTGIIPEEITKRTGVTLNPTRAADDKQLGLMIASGDLPELVYTDTQIDRLSDSQFCCAWNELIEEHAPDFRPADMSIMIAKSFSKDDNYYTILNAFSTEEEWKAAKSGAPSFPSLLYREDIIQELGNPSMKTIDDYLNVMGMVKEKYPDMTPLIMDQTFLLKPIKQWMIPGWTSGAYELCRLDDGSIIFMTSSPQYIDFLRFANTCYRNGFISADNFAFKDDSQSLQIAVTGKAFSYCWYTGNNTAEQLTSLTQKNGDPDALWQHAAPLVDDAKLYMAGIGWSGVFITKNCKDPARAIKFMQWMFSDEGQRLTQWGREGIDYTLDDNGCPVFSDEWNEARNDERIFYEKYNPAFYFGISGVT